MNPWELLLRRLLAARTWPLATEAAVRQRIATWSALRESHEPTIRRLMRWPRDRHLVIDNLPEKIVSAYGDLLHSGELRYTAGGATGATNGDQERGEEMIEPWSSELPAAEETCASEGEVWWRLSIAPGLPHPVLTWHSRWDVVPLLHGRNVLAAAFTSRLDSPGSARHEVWRHVELHGAGIVINLLFRGRENALGQQLDLERHRETAGLPERWDTELPGLMCGRVPHRWGRRPHQGVSIYQGVWSRFLSINEAVTIGRENMRLTAKKRAIVPSSAIRSAGDLPEGQFEAGVDRGDGSFDRQPVAQFDAGEDVLVHDPLDVNEGGSGAAPFKVLEYSFDSAALIAWTQFEVNSACQRCDIVPQFIGEGDFGSGLSGYSFRVRLLPTVNAAEGAGRPWDLELPRIAQLCQLLEAREAPFGGIGRTDWADPAAAPAIERTSELPEDPTEVAQRHATLKTADLISIAESVRERHRDWSPEQVDAEVEAIRADIASTMPPVTPIAP